jgi:hypothetical protein
MKSKKVRFYGGPHHGLDAETLYLTLVMGMPVLEDGFDEDGGLKFKTAVYRRHGITDTYDFQGWK